MMRYIFRKIIIFLPVLLFLTQFNSHAGSQDGIIAAAVSNKARSDSDRERDKSSKPVDVLSFFGVKPGMHILDLFSGSGYYSEILSHITGVDGKIVAHTNKAYAKFVGKEVAERFRDNRLPNVIRLTSEIPDLKIGQEQFDMILMVMTYHDVYYESENWPKVDRDSFFKQLHNAIKSGGILAIIDHSAKAGTGSAAAQELHRIDEQFARNDVESAGFKLAGQTDILRNPDDDRTIVVFDEKIRYKTDRFVYKFIRQ